jgi:hypothetical protein
VRGVAFAVLFLGVLVAGREFYEVLQGPAHATESILRDAARLAGNRGGLSGPASPGLDLDVPGFGSIERFSRLWATVPRRMTEHVAPSQTAPPERASTPERARTPPTDEEGYLALPNGTELIPPAGKRGLGAVQVVNLTDHEAVAELASESARETALRLVYIRAGAEATLREIGAGVYYLRFWTGEEWLPRSRDFARYRARGGPVGPLAFFQFQTDEGMQADRYEITLKPAPARR